jgi:hypothetical protein
MARKTASADSPPPPISPRPDEALIRFDLDDGPDESTTTDTIGVAQGSLQGTVMVVARMS